MYENSSCMIGEKIPLNILVTCVETVSSSIASKALYQQFKFPVACNIAVNYFEVFKDV